MTSVRGHICSRNLAGLKASLRVRIARGSTGSIGWSVGRNVGRSIGRSIGSFVRSCGRSIRTTTSSRRIGRSIGIRNENIILSTYFFFIRQTYTKKKKKEKNKNRKLTIGESHFRIVTWRFRVPRQIKPGHKGVISFCLIPDYELFRACDTIVWFAFAPLCWYRWCDGSGFSWSRNVALVCWHIYIGFTASNQDMINKKHVDEDNPYPLGTYVVVPKWLDHKIL